MTAAFHTILRCLHLPGRMLLICGLLAACPLAAQPGIGLRFATNLNYFPSPADYNLAEGVFTTGVFGVFLNNYTDKSGFDLGLNVAYKDHDGRGFPNLPVVMRDYGENQNVGYTGIEMDLKVGPRLYAFYPKIGYVLGYRVQQAGFQTAGGTNRINRWYLMLPFGLSTYLPTQFGSVGFGGFYHLGLLNVLRNPGSGSPGTIYDGGRQRYITFEITVSYGLRP